MKNKLGLFAFAALLAGAALAFGLSACSNGSDGTPIIIVMPGANNATDGSNTNSGGTSEPTTTTPITTTTATETGGGQTQNPTPITYTITFNANDGSQNPDTATQTFTAGTSQALKTIAELGFSKSGFNFAGWGTTVGASESSYADGASYTASADATLYALWSAIPVYSVNIPVNEHGTVTASPATATAGTEITLSNTPNEGYQFASYSVTDAAGGTVTVMDGKFTMPAKNVTVTAVFTVLTYTITFNANDGSPNPDTATQTFTARRWQALKTIEELGFSKSGYNFAGWGTSSDASESSYADGASYTANVDITLYAMWSAIYSVNIPVNEHGTVTASPATAKAGTEITLSNTPNAGYQFASYSVTDADGGTVAVANGKFTMPAKDVNVTATFNAINYSISIGSYSTNCIVTASPETATVGTIVTITANPEPGYELSAVSVKASAETYVSVSGTGNSRTFVMPANNVIVSTSSRAIEYNVNVGTFVNGRLIGSSKATVGQRVHLSIHPDPGYKLETLIVTADGGATVELSGVDHFGRNFTMPAKNVTVTATFMEASMTLGLWPQTIMAQSVTVNENESKTVGSFTYCKGSDGEWYVKIKENAYKGIYKYSDGTTVAQNSADSYKWFKVEPIKWRVLTTNYNGTGKKLLHAESILIGKRYDARFNNYQNSEIRKWLNSNANSAAASDYGDSAGFLKTAFTAAEIAAIVDTSVNNNTRSTLPDNYDSFTDSEKQYHWGAGQNQYASDTPTIDKVFLLSEQEATKIEYDFDYYDQLQPVADSNTRIRYSTDYARASGAMYSTAGAGLLGGHWWLRSPCYHRDDKSRRVSNYGYAAEDNERDFVSADYVGVVPALCLKN